jgi:hypothetical protein
VVFPFVYAVFKGFSKNSKPQIVSKLCAKYFRCPPLDKSKIGASVWVAGVDVSAVDGAWTGRHLKNGGPSDSQDRW